MTHRQDYTGIEILVVHVFEGFQRTDALHRPYQDKAVSNTCTSKYIIYKHDCMYVCINIDRPSTYVILTEYKGNTGEYLPERRSREGRYSGGARWPHGS